MPTGGHGRCRMVVLMAGCELIRCELAAALAVLEVGRGGEWSEGIDHSQRYRSRSTRQRRQTKYGEFWDDGSGRGTS